MVCLGNICRSPLAHGILASKLPADKFYVDSAGTGNYHIGSKPDHRSIEVASNFGIDISNQKCRQFVAADFDNFHLIYVMDDSNYNNVIKLARNPSEVKKIRRILTSENNNLTEVPDPYYGDQEDFKNVYDILENACERISRELEILK